MRHVVILNGQQREHKSGVMVWSHTFPVRVSLFTSLQCIVIVVKRSTVTLLLMCVEFLILLTCVFFF